MSSASCRLDPYIARERIGNLGSGGYKTLLWEGGDVNILEKGFGAIFFKELTSDPAIVNQYHPISNFPFEGKVIDRVMDHQLQRTLEEMDSSTGCKLLLLIIHGRS